MKLFSLWFMEYIPCLMYPNYILLLKLDGNIHYISR